MFAQMLLFALLSVVVAFSLAAAESAIFRMSRVRAAELAEEGRSGSLSLVTVVADSAAYLAVLAFLRVVAEATCAVFITVAVLSLLDSVAVGADHLDRHHGRRLVRRRRRLPADPGTAELRHRRALGRPGRGRSPQGPRPGLADPRRAGQRGHAGQGLPRRPVPERGGAARPARHGRRHRGHRGGRAGDDPLGLRARRHRRSRGDGPADRHGDHQPGQDAPAGHVAVHPLAGSRGSRSSATTATTRGACSTSRTSCGGRMRTPTASHMPVDQVDAPAALRPGEQARRRPAPGDAARAEPLRDGRRRVRRDRRAGHHRGHPRGDRRRDRRRVRQGVAAGPGARGRRRSGYRPG